MSVYLEGVNIKRTSSRKPKNGGYLSHLVMLKQLNFIVTQSRISKKEGKEIENFDVEGEKTI